MFGTPWRRKARLIAARTAYGRIVARAREPAFYRDWGVPDTLDGRFELLTLHAFIVLNRLKRERARSQDFAQDLFDFMFADLDRGIREMGATDIGVGRHVKAMARGFFGRVAAYDKGLGDEAELRAALSRNLYGTIQANDAQIAVAALYVKYQVEALAAQPLDTLMTGEVSFAPMAE